MGAAEGSAYAEFYRTSPYASFPQEHRSAGSTPVSFVRAEQGAHEMVDAAVPELVLTSVLADVPEPTASITAGCGFSSQSHLTRLFRRRFDTTPARYRRDALR